MDKEKIKEKAQEWIENNKAALPINIDYWEIGIQEVVPQIYHRPISFGKYDDSNLRTNSFYKSISRIIKN